MTFRADKIVAHLSCWIPLCWLVWAIFARQLGADPQKELLHQLGLWSLRFLLICLCMTPLRQLGWSQALRFRRMLGLYSAFYLLLHFVVFYLFILETDLWLLASEIVKRPYITLGILALLMMLPLVITSTKRMQKRLGRNWKKLHWLVYPIAVLGVIHFIWQSKSDLNEPLWYALWLLLLLSYRGKDRLKRWFTASFQSNAGSS